MRYQLAKFGTMSRCTATSQSIVKHKLSRPVSVKWRQTYSKAKTCPKKHTVPCKCFRHSDQTSDTFKFSMKSVHLSVNYEQMQETKHSRSFHFSDFTSLITFLLSLLRLRAPTSQANTGEKQLTWHITAS